jgi:hypothetical protein
VCGAIVTLVPDRAALDLRHVGLIVSAGAAVSLRFLSDFGFGTIQDNARSANLDLAHPSLTSFGRLVLQVLVDALQRDYFNLSPQAPLQAICLVAGLVGVYLVLRRMLTPETAVLAVLIVTPFVPLAAAAGACGWLLLRAASTG